MNFLASDGEIEEKCSNCGHSIHVHYVELDYDGDFMTNMCCLADCECWIPEEDIKGIIEPIVLDYDCARHGKGKGLDCPTCFDSDNKLKGRYVP